MCLQGEGQYPAVKDRTCTGDAAKCCGNCGDAGVGSYGVAKSPLELRIAELLHESNCVAINAVFGEAVPTLSWSESGDAITQSMLFQARFILERYVMLPIDNTAACSGCRTCTEALDRLDCARRDFISVLEEARMLRDALAGLVGASEKDELEQLEQAILAMPAPPEDRAFGALAIDGIHALLKAGYSKPSKEPGAPAGQTHEECTYCAFYTATPAACAGRPNGPAACPSFKGATVC